MALVLPLIVLRSWVGGIVLVLAVRGGAKRCTLKRVISPLQAPCSLPTVSHGSWSESAFTIHKSQSLTLSNATIDIGKVEQEELTFTIISHV
jgi:hypothetical protein